MKTYPVWVFEQGRRVPRPEVDSHERHGQHDTGTEYGRSGRPAAR